MPILFPIRRLVLSTGPNHRRGVPPSLRGFIPLPADYYVISGVTRDSGGAALGLCTVKLFRTSDDVEVDQVISDASGNFEFRSPAPATNYYMVGYLAGSPDVFGTTLNTLTAV